MKIFLHLLFSFLVYLSYGGVCNAHVDSVKLTEECNIADICRHDQVPVCGIDSCGEMRTFIDVCDMHEFNCDSKKDPYVAMENCGTLHCAWSDTHLAGFCLLQNYQCLLCNNEVFIFPCKPYWWRNLGSLKHKYKRVFIQTSGIKLHKDFVQKPTHECWVTCKRGRSFKKPEFRTDCDVKKNMI